MVACGGAQLTRSMPGTDNGKHRTEVAGLVRTHVVQEIALGVLPEPVAPFLLQDAHAKQK